MKTYTKRCDELERNGGILYKEKDKKTIYYLSHYRPHREDGPAISGPGHNSWYKNGMHHRDNGPAVLHYDGENFSFEYWYYGVQATNEREFYDDDWRKHIYANKL